MSATPRGHRAEESHTQREQSKKQIRQSEKLPEQSHTTAGDKLWEGFRESGRCSRDTYPESYITEYILIYEE